jgi:hypothetical protein
LHYPSGLTVLRCSVSTPAGEGAKHDAKNSNVI